MNAAAFGTGSRFWRSSGAILSILVLLLSLLVLIFPAKVSADNHTFVSDNNIDQKIRAMKYYAAFNFCWLNNPTDDAIRTSMNDEQVRKGPRHWMPSPTLSSNSRDAYFGVLLSPSNSPCNDGGDTGKIWVESALRALGLWGSNNYETLENLGFNCIQGEGCENDDARKQGNSSNVMANIRRNSPYLDGRDPNARPSLDYSAMTYFASLAALQSACGASPGAGTGTQITVTEVDRTTGEVGTPQTWTMTESLGHRPDSGVPLYWAGGNDPDHKWQLDEHSSSQEHNGVTCERLAQLTVERADAFSEWLQADQDRLGQDPGGGPGGPDQTPTGCNAESLSLKWFICPLIEGGLAVIALWDGYINSLLNVEPDTIFGNASSNNWYSIWSALRTLSLALIVIAALVMVISQASGMEMLDAYTIRRILPRLLLAAVGITLSWPLLELAVTVSNDLGLGIRALIYAPFSDIITNGEISISGAGTATGGVIGSIGLFALGLFGALSMVVTALIAVIMAALLLVFRELLILLLIIVAPIAIACAILPNTQRVWKLWYNTLTKLLLMFLFISALIATGRVVAFTASGAPGTELDFLSLIIVLVAYFGPYFMIIWAFNKAGGVMAVAANFANRGFQRANAPIKQFRSNAVQRNMQNVAKGKRFRGSNVVTRGLNKAGEYAAAAPGAASEMGLSAFIRPGEAINRVKSKVNENRQEAIKAAQEDASFAEVKDDSGALSAGIASRSRGDIEAALRDQGRDETDVQRTTAAVLRAQESLGTNFDKAAVIAKAGTGDGYNDADGGVGHAVEDIVRVSGGDRNAEAQMFNAVKGSFQGARRYDALSGFGAFFEAREHVAGRKGGRGPEWSTQQINDHIVDNALDIQGAQAVVHSRGDGVRAFVPALQRRMTHATQEVVGAHQVYERAQASGDPAQVAAAQRGVADAQRRLEQHVASSEALIDTASAGAPEAGRTLADGFHELPVHLDAMPDDVRDWLSTNPDGSRTTETQLSMRDLMRHLAGRPGVEQMRRNYGSEYSADAARRAAAGPPGVPPPPGPGVPPPTGGGASSDRRLKRDIVYLGDHAITGIPLYRFKYIWSKQEYVGVIAQDLLQTHPEAISKGPDGYYLVDYRVIEVEFKEFDPAANFESVEPTK